jgi:micrococcal nuclease
MVEVRRLIDGDTLELSTGEAVCLIGVDTPETKDPRKPVQYFGKEATAFT